MYRKELVPFLSQSVCPVLFLVGGKDGKCGYKYIGVEENLV